jgi:hypothetical protein
VSVPGVTTPVAEPVPALSTTLKIELAWAIDHTERPTVPMMSLSSAVEYTRLSTMALGNVPVSWN